MGGYLSAPPKTDVQVVLEVVGHFNHPDGWSDGKARMWIFGDKTAAVYVPGPTGLPIRHTLEFTEVNLVRKTVELVLTDNRSATLMKKECACGFGATAFAGPIEDPYNIEWVRPLPEWFHKN